MAEEKEKLKIYTDYITEKTKRRKGDKIDKAKFIVLHSVQKSSEHTAKEVIQDYQKSSQKEYFGVHTVIDDQGVYECIPASTDAAEKVYQVDEKIKIDEKKFGASANDVALAVQLCYLKDKDKMKKAVENAVQYIAYLCYKYKLNPNSALTSHKILSNNKKINDPDEALKSIGLSYADYIKKIKEAYKKGEKDGTFEDTNVEVKDVTGVDENSDSEDGLDSENSGFKISTDKCEGDKTLVIIEKKPLRHTMAQPLYPDLLPKYSKTLTEKEQEEIEKHIEDTTDDNGIVDDKYVAGQSVFYSFQELAEKGVDVARVFFTYDDYKKRESTFDTYKYRYNSKLTNVGKPANNNDPYPIDEKIEELEQHIPFMKIHKLMFCDPSHHIVDLAQIIMDFSDKAEKRIVQLENILATVMRQVYRLGARVPINCVYYGGQSEYRKYAAIRCMHHDRGADGQLMTLDQCLNCTRYEPVMGKTYDITDATGNNLDMTNDVNQMAYQTMDDQLVNTLSERMTDSASKKLLSTKNLTKRDKSEKDFKDMWSKGFIMDWDFVDVEKQKPNVYYEDGSTTKTLDSNYKNIQDQNDPTGAGFTGIQSTPSVSGQFDGGSGGSGTGDLGDLSGFDGGQASEMIKMNDEVFDKATGELATFVKEAKSYVNQNYKRVLSNMKKYQYKEHILSYAKKTKIDPLIILGIIGTESGGDPSSGNPNYVGLMGTRRDSTNMSGSGASRAPGHIKIGTSTYSGKRTYFKNKYGAVNDMVNVVAYNAGEGAADSGFSKSGFSKLTFDKVWQGAANHYGPGKRKEIGEYYPKVHYFYKKFSAVTDLGGSESSSVEESITSLKDGEKLKVQMPFKDSDMKDKTIKLTSPYGIRDRVGTTLTWVDAKGKEHKAGAGLEFHRGVDLAEPSGEIAIYAAIDGKVEHSGPYSSGGNAVIITGAHGIKVLCMHMKNGSLKVKKGDKVKAGDRIGTMGNTGGSYGVHLHFELQRQMKSGKWTNYNPANVFSFLKKENKNKSLKDVIKFSKGK